MQRWKRDKTNKLRKGVSDNIIIGKLSLSPTLCSMISKCYLKDESQNLKVDQELELEFIFVKEDSFWNTLKKLVCFCNLGVR